VINFRYHVVSLTAVFLALAIGLVVGTAALNGPSADYLNEQVTALSRQNQQYRDQVNSLADQANKREDFANEAASLMIGDRLVGRRVAVVSMSSGDKYVDPLLTMLQENGVKVTARMEIGDKFTDPAGNAELLDLAHTTLPPSITGLPTNSNGVETSAALLAAVLLDRNPAVPDDARRSVISAYQQLGYIVVPGQVTSAAETVIFVAGPPYVDKDAPKRNAAVLTISDQFDKAAPIVVAGNTLAGDGNTLAALRADPTLSKTVSTVENIATPQGRVITALAVVEQLQGRCGHYGTETAGRTALMPRLTDKTRSGS
jgi:hypothetical protein